jgi:hypothetical protein
VKELFAEVPLGLGYLEERVGPSIGEPGLRKLGIMRWNHQLPDATDLLIDEPAQLRGAVALSGGDSNGQQEHAERRESGERSLKNGAAVNAQALQRGNELRDTLRVRLW